MSANRHYTETIHDWAEPNGGGQPHYRAQECAVDITPKPKFYEVMQSQQSRAEALAQFFYRMNGFMPAQQEPEGIDPANCPFTFISPTANSVSLDDIIGLERPKKLFHRIIQQELNYKAFFDYINMADPDAKRCTVLLYGPPGNGKTLLAKALAASANGAFLSIDTARLIDTYVGTGPANVEKIKQVIFKCKEQLVVVFLDEFDAIGNRMNATSGGEQERGNTINQLLTLMEGIQGLPPDKRMIFLGATNRKDLIDSALLSRFFYKIEVPDPLPEERMMHFKKHLREKRLVPYKGEEADLRVNWADVINNCDKFSGRDIRNLFIQLKDQLLSDLDELTLERLTRNSTERARFKLSFTNTQILNVIDDITREKRSKSDNILRLL